VMHWRGLVVHLSLQLWICLGFYIFHLKFILLFRGQFRSSLKCTNPTCGFKNLTFEPYLCVSLSVPFAQKFFK
jgi:hypothetical protein